MKFVERACNCFQGWGNNAYTSCHDDDVLCEYYLVWLDINHVSVDIAKGFILSKLHNISVWWQPTPGLEFPTWQSFNWRVLYAYALARLRVLGIVFDLPIYKTLYDHIREYFLRVGWLDYYERNLSPSFLPKLLLITHLLSTLTSGFLLTFGNHFANFPIHTKEMYVCLCARLSCA